MSDNRTLLVVDDEQVICQACRRIFSRQGFQVEESTDPREGLNQATEKDYTGILLDIKMPSMDGIQFLERLRASKPDVPVLIMTGYPSVPNAAAAIRLGAADYITKPFTPEEITQAVQRMLSHGPGNGHGVVEPQPGAVAADAEPPPPHTEGCLFLDESWFQLEADGSACVGAVLPGLQGETVEAVRLPRIGEVVYQGLPLAGLKVAGKPQVTVRAPVSGVIAAVNEALSDNPSLVVGDPCGQGWIACICTTRFEEEAGRCRQRRVLLVNADGGSGQTQSARLASLGCQVRVVAARDELAEVAEGAEEDLLVLDGASFGEEGPALVAQVNAVAPSMKVVVIACPEDHWETAYRKQKIFYYAMEPFADNEMADILDAAFRSQEPQHAPPGKPERQASEAVSSIAITNRNGHKVQLLAAPGLLWRNEGLGAGVRHKLIDRMFPIVTTPGEASTSPAEVLKAAGKCDRLMVLSAKDSGQLPGALARDTKAELGTTGGESPTRVTTLVIQPDAVGGLTGLEPRITSALAEHIVREMASY